MSAVYWAMVGLATLAVVANTLFIVVALTSERPRYDGVGQFPEGTDGGERDDAH